MQEARRREAEPGFKKRYAARAGIVGTLSQGVRRSDQRRARYVGQKKTHLQNVCTAVALNPARLWNWLAETPTGLHAPLGFCQALSTKGGAGVGEFAGGIPGYRAP